MSKIKTWDCKKHEFIDMPEKMKKFIDEIEKVCEKHCLSISHEDGHGAFEIETYKEINIEWLKHANKNY